MRNAQRVVALVGPTISSTSGQYTRKNSFKKKLQRNVEMKKNLKKKGRKFVETKLVLARDAFP